MQECAHGASLLAEAQLRGWFEGVGSEVAGQELGPRGGGDHGGIVGGERNAGKGDGEMCRGGHVLEHLAQVAIGSDASADEYAAGAKVLGGVEGGASEILDHGVLEAGNEVEGLGVEVWQRVREVGLVGLGFVQADVAEGVLADSDGGMHPVQLDVATSGCLDAGEGHVEAGGVIIRRESGFAGELGRGVAGDFLFNLREGEERGVCRAVRGECIHPGAAGVGQAEQLGDLVEGLAGGVVEGFSDVAVAPG